LVNIIISILSNASNVQGNFAVSQHRDIYQYYGNLIFAFILT